MGDEEGAERAMTAACDAERFRLAINAYFFGYIPILLGIVTAAAGVERSIGRAAERLDLGSALALSVGTALFLIGDVLFRRTMRIRPVAYRATAAGGALGTVVLGVYVAAAAQTLALVAVVVIALAAEAARGRLDRKAKAPRPRFAASVEGRPRGDG